MYFKIKLLTYAIIHRQEQRGEKTQGAWNQTLRKKIDLYLEIDPIINENYTI